MNGADWWQQQQLLERQRYYDDLINDDDDERNNINEHFAIYARTAQTGEAQAGNHRPER